MAPPPGGGFRYNPLVDWRESEKSIFLARIYRLKGQKAYPQMEEEAKAALERYPGEALFRLLLADAFHHQGRPGEAEAIVEDLQESAQQLALFHALRGDLQVRHKDFTGALESFRQAQTLQDSPYYVKRQADCLLQLGRFAEALANLRRLPPDEDDPYLWNSLARAYEGLGELPKAEECYGRLLKLQPGNSFARAAMLRLKSSGREEAAVEKELDRMLRMPSRRDDPALLRLKADQLKKQGRFEEAARLYAQLVESSAGPDSEFYWRLLAFAHHKAGNAQEAYPLLCRLVEKNALDSYARNALITAGRKLGRGRELVDFFLTLARQSEANRPLFGVARKLRKTLSRKDSP